MGGEKADLRSGHIPGIKFSNISVLGLTRRVDSLRDWDVLRWVLVR